METQKEALEILDLTVSPGFSVRNSIITAVNQAAAGLMITPGTDVKEILLTGKEEYARFEGGCLYLKLNLQPGGIGTTVVRMEGTDLFLLDPEYADSALQAMALASVQLRDPLTSAMSDMALVLSREDSTEKEPLKRLNRALYQMHRILCNMSDAGLWQRSAYPELRNMRMVFEEIFEKAQSTLEKSGIQLSCQGLDEDIYTTADGAQLERAALNMLSNALKFSPKGSTVRASVTRQGRMLLLSIRDEGSGISQKIRSSVFSRYLRQPAPEESRFGLGLGLVLIRATAAVHGGTVLIDHPDGVGTRITMTIAIRNPAEATLRSPVFRVDYSGERDHALVELSEILSPDLY